MDPALPEFVVAGCVVGAAPSPGAPAARTTVVPLLALAEHAASPAPRTEFTVCFFLSFFSFISLLIGSRFFFLFFSETGK